MTASGARAMRDTRRAGKGSAARRRAGARGGWIVAALAVIGFVPGLYVGFQHGAAAAQSRTHGVWSPAVAALLAGLYLVAVAGGAVL